MIEEKLTFVPRMKASLEYSQIEYNFYSDMLNKIENVDLREKIINAQNKILHEIEQESSDYKILSAAVNALSDVQKQIIINIFFKNTIKSGSQKAKANDFYKSIGLTRYQAYAQRKAALKTLEAAYLTGQAELSVQQG
ncbi:MAG: hypothetical protein ACOYKJ_06485 [Candidatus Howiella sp.]|jgi:hypothetical protein